MRRHSVAASLLCADLNNLERDIESLSRSGVDIIHFDVMDGQFVNGFGLSEKLLRRVRPITPLPIEVHLMTVNPENHIADFAGAGADVISVHIEACVHAHRTVSMIKQHGIGAGIVLNPATPVDSVQHLLDDVEVVTLMSINPGMLGADFLPLVFDKIRELRALIENKKPGTDPKIQIDGSLDRQLAQEVFLAGSDISIHGARSFFNSDEPLESAARAVVSAANAHSEHSDSTGI